MKSRIGRLALLSAAILGLAACECKDVSAKTIFVNGSGNADSAVCEWTRGATVVICTRYSAGAAARKDTSGLGQ